MAVILKYIRLEKFHFQHGRCYYCGCGMWEGQPDSAHAMLGEEARWYQSTAEHLIARSAGGSDAPENIVAACLRCNSHRHQMVSALPPLAYRNFVKGQIRKGCWHTAAPG